VNTITRKNLSVLLAKRMGMKGTLARQAVDEFFQAIIEAVIQGNRIEVRGFGVWEVKKTNPRPNARNPMTGKQVSVPARRKVHFKPGKELKTVLGQPLEDEA